VKQACNVVDRVGGGRGREFRNGVTSFNDSTVELVLNLREPKSRPSVTSFHHGEDIKADLFAIKSLNTALHRSTRCSVPRYLR